MVKPLSLDHGRRAQFEAKARQISEENREAEAKSVMVPEIVKLRIGTFSLRDLELKLSIGAFQFAWECSHAPSGNDASEPREISPVQAVVVF